MILRSCWHDFLITLYITSVQFPNNAKPMSRIMRSQCQYASAKPMSKRVPDNAKPMSRRMRSRNKNSFAYVKNTAKPMSRLMWSLCQEECEADVKILGSRARICWISISTELGGNVSHASWVGKYPVQVVWECVPCKLGGTRSHLTQTENVPTQLARDTFPPYWHGTRSHTTLMGHVPT